VGLVIDPLSLRPRYPQQLPTLSHKLADFLCEVEKQFLRWEELRTCHAQRASRLRKSSLDDDSVQRSAFSYFRVGKYEGFHMSNDASHIHRPDATGRMHPAIHKILAAFVGGWLVITLAFFLGGSGDGRAYGSVIAAIVAVFGLIVILIPWDIRHIGLSHPGRRNIDRPTPSRLDESGIPDLGWTCARPRRGDHGAVAGRRGDDRWYCFGNCLPRRAVK